MLSPRAIAVLGIGYGPEFVAVEGLWPSGTPPVETAKSMAQRDFYFYADGQVQIGPAPTLAEENDELLELYQMYLARRVH